MDKGPRVLVVDDEEIVLVSVKRILSKEGFEVETSDKADDALARVEQKDYDLVITDLMMPRMNGIELMHSIREKGKDMPFLMITGYPTIKTAMQALRLGALDYIPKPFTRVELLSPVNRALHGKPASRPARTEAPESVSSDAPAPGDRFVLSGHSWAVYEQEGTLAVGIEGSFLESAGQVVKIEAPGDNEMVEQGYPTIRLKTGDGGEHGVFSPFSGRVVAVNREALGEPSLVGKDTWLIRIIPSSLKEETQMLVRT